MGKIWRAILNPRAGVAQILLAAVIIGLVVLDQQGYLQAIKSWLNDDALALDIGARRFSLYIFLSTIFTFLVISWITGIVAAILKKRVAKLTHMHDNTRILVVHLAQIFGYTLAVLLALNVMGIDLTAFAVVGGAIGVGIGFGLQKIASNFISGLILLFEKSIEVGDLVELQDGTVGFVRHTGARYTLVETFQNYDVMVPNEDFITQRVTNWTYDSNQGRVEIPIGVSYGSDIEKAQSLILEAATEHPRCLSDPEAVCFLRDFADSSVNFILFFYVADVREGRYGPQSEVMLAIWHKFKANNIEIPYPQHDVHIRSGK